MNLRLSLRRVRREPRALGTEIRRTANLLRYRRVDWAISGIKASRIVEVGVHRADRSPRLIKAALRHSADVHFWGFDLFAEMATDQRLAEEAMPGGRPLDLAEVETMLARLGATVELIAGDTRDTLPLWAENLDQPIDVAFIDGGHSYETVRSDWDALRSTLHSESIVFFDDYMRGQEAQALGCGVAAVVDEIDRSAYRVDLLHPIDTAALPFPPGRMRTRLARVTPLPGTAVTAPHR